jgi:hypothetical protein
MPLDPAATGIAVVVLGALGWLYKRFVFKRDQRVARKSEFLSYMTRWQSDVSSWLGIYHAAANDFVERKSEFVGKASVMEANYGFLNRCRFKKRVDAICNMTGGEVDNNTQNEKGELVGVRALLDRITALIRFVKRN